ncbi:MAG: protein-disulfide reductase DsbD [Sulfurimonas sp.]|uniref:protein-disulfide reductase DsbD n=1 Tax=Sulfurimonas sp. TaxID=2022749 RepID=UPI0025D63D7B|nr:protein-disulfide reductase DsbD [Sulfurimonas sp.]MCK9490985.1 protein-disulfide reductase DsbD [Sulfurimonas sp.]
MKKLLVLLLTLSITLFGASKFMMPDEAFKPKATINASMQIEATVEIAKEIYLYAEQLKIEVKKGSGVSIAKVEKPKSVEHHEEMVYLESPTFIITLQKDSQISGMQNIEFVLSYQGCSEQGLCYEPLSETFSFEVDTSKLELASTAKSDVVTKDVQKSFEVAPKEESVSETDAIANTIKSGNITLVLLTFLGFGLLLALTPCVFPMIPIISGVIISQGEGITTKRAFGLSVVYVLAMAVAYTIAGVLAGLFGANLQAALQTPWVIYSFAGVFVVLAFSMFGFYELKLPDSLVAKVSKNSNRGGYVGVAIMGFLSALIVGPCVAAPLAGALVYIGQTGDAVLGGLALFFMSIGMGIPLIAVGVSAGKFMPKPGEWMTMVSAIFGVMMLFVAVWMLERVVDTYVTMLLYAMLGIGFAIYLGAFERETHIFKRSVALISFIYFTALLIGALGGSTSMIKPLSFLQSAASTTQVETKDLDYTTVKSIAELDELLVKHKGKKIMLDFYASWCVSCKELDAVTFADAGVQAKLSEFVFIKADITENSKEQKALSKKYGVFGPPALIFFDASSNIISSKTIIGFVGPDEFLAHLNQI